MRLLRGLPQRGPTTASLTLIRRHRTNAAVAKLEEALNDPLTQAEAAGAIRTLIDAVVLHPRRAARASASGSLWRLAALLELGQANKKTRVGETRVSMVAGEDLNL